MRLSDLPIEVIQQIPPFSASVQHYLVTDYNEKRQGIMDAKGGVHVYGEEDWDLIINGMHPEVSCEIVEVVLH